MKNFQLGAACAAVWIGAGMWQAQDAPVEAEQGQRVPHVAVDAPERGEAPAGPELVFAVQPKALSETVRRGLEWLRLHQHEDGGWSQGEEAAGMRRGEVRNQLDGPQADPANVADTCVAALALLRSGSTPSAGAYAEELRRAVAFVCASVEAADEESLWVTDVRGTRVQSKIGTYVDTFLASMLLTEVRDDMPDEKADARVGAALRKVLDKIERNQAQDGGFTSQGWAPVLSQGLAGKALNRASMLGVEVAGEVLASNDAFFLARQDVSAGGSAAADAAGVQLYGGAAKLGAQQEAVNNGYRREGELRDRLQRTSDADELKEIEGELDRITAGRQAQKRSQEAMIAQLGDKSFVEGFGNNGGEEFLSYMNISESLVVQADDAWRRWDESVSRNVSNVQNEDGSWTGHHCITGRTFCTATALMTLMADRTRVPAELLANR